MNSILISIIIVSVLHAIIPSHWLPLLAIAKKNNWQKNETLKVAFYMSLAHVFSTLILAALVSQIGIAVNHQLEEKFSIIAPIILIAMGLFFIYRHYKHHHFHINEAALQKNDSKVKVIVSLVVMMFFSPCLEVETFFFSAAPYGAWFVITIGLIYAIISILGIIIWVAIALAGVQRFNWHKIEHNAGLFTGFTLILCGILTYFIH